MKAGIYKTPNGNLIYVAKDRSIRAYTKDDRAQETTEAHRKEFRVRSRNRDQQIELEDGTLCNRVADVPNGCNDPEKALAEALREEYRKAHPTIAERAAAAFKSHPLPAKVLIIDEETEYPKVSAAALIANCADAMREQTGNPPRVLLTGDGVEITPQTMRDAGYRVCHRQSARKHRRRGHEVVYVPALNAHAWRKVA